MLFDQNVTRNRCWLNVEIGRKHIYHCIIQLATYDHSQLAVIIT